MFIDYYELLGINETATPKEIKSAFHREIKKYHPDRNMGNGNSDRTSQLIEANSILVNVEARASYDKEYQLYKANAKQQAKVKDDTDESGNIINSDGGEKDYSEGLNYYCAKNYSEAFRYLHRAAMQNHVKAQYFLGMIYYYGSNYNSTNSQYLEEYVRRDLLKLDYYYYRKTDSKEIPINYSEAFKWFLKASQKGNESAQIMLGNMYALGEGVTKNIDEGLYWVKKAAETGDMNIRLTANCVISILNNMNKKVEPKFGCFIATACYGTYNAPEVMVLRKYRDTVLLNTLIGTAFVKFYYFVSPPIARQLEKYDSAKMIIRKYLLYPIVEKIKKTSDIKAKLSTADSEKP